MTETKSRKQAIDDIVLEARVRYLLLLSPAGIIISPIASLALSLALLGDVGIVRLVTWNMGLVGLALLRFGIWLSSPRDAAVVPRPRYWETLMAATMVTVALWWGVGGLFVLPGTPVGDLLIFCVLMMMAGGTGALYSIHPVASSVSVVCLTVPVLVFFAMHEPIFLRVLSFGTVLLVIGILRGIQTLNRYLVRVHELAYDLEENVGLLKRSEEMRRDLTLMLVHDLRTPLAGLITNAHLAREYAQEEDTEEAVGEIQKTAELAESLVLMVSSILDVNRLESDQLPLSEEVVSVDELVDSSLQLLGRSAELVQVESIPGVKTRCDLELLSRVLTNLLGNALRFQPPQEPVRLVVVAHGGDLEFSVVDRGPGVPVEDRTRIFDKYTQTSRATRTYTSGLGLTFCKMVVERHGGRIGVRSHSGGGSEFWFRIALQAD